MAKFGLSAMLANPAFDALLAAHIGSNLMQSKLAADEMATRPDATSQMFASYAARTGQMAPEMPRTGFFEKLGARMGILSPTQTPRPKDILAESEILQKRSQMMTEEAKTFDEIRKTSGPEGYAKIMSGPLGDLARNIGFPTELPQATTQEKVAASIEADRKTRAAQAQERIDITRKGEDTREKAFALLKSHPQPGTQAWYNMKATERAVETTAAGEAQSRLMNTSWDYYMLKRPNSGFVDVRNMAAIDRRKYRTPGDALRDPNVVPVQGKLMTDAANVRQSLQWLNRMEEIWPQISVSTHGKPTIVKSADIRWNQAKMLYEYYGGQNPLVTEFYNKAAYIMRLGHDLQGRFASNAELQALTNSAVPNGGQSTQAGMALLMSLRKNLKAGFTGMAQSAGAEASADDAAALLNEITYGPGDEDKDAGLTGVVTAPGTTEPPEGTSPTMREGAAILTGGGSETSGTGEAP